MSDYGGWAINHKTKTPRGKGRRLDIIVRGVCTAVTHCWQCMSAALCWSMRVQCQPGESEFWALLSVLGHHPLLPSHTHQNMPLRHGTLPNWEPMISGCEVNLPPPFLRSDAMKDGCLTTAGTIKRN